MSDYDLIVRGGTVAVTGGSLTACDIGVKGGVVTALGSGIAGDADEVVDAEGLLVLPGAVDAHVHLGVYRDLAADAASETAAGLRGGVTTVFTYFRTGGHYLDSTGTYADLVPKVIDEIAAVSYADFGLHVAPITAGHLDEIPWLIEEAGVASLKFYFHYVGGERATSRTAGATRAIPDEYDLGHLFAIMSRLAPYSSGGDSFRVSLNLHCESADLVRYFTQVVSGEAQATLAAHSAGRPPVCERLSIHEAGVLADVTGVPINLVHLSSAEALAAARELRSLYPALDVQVETTTHHLCLTTEEVEHLGVLAKVNPPIRTPADRDALWAGVVDRSVNWVASDHACCLEERKLESPVPGFGSNALLYPALLTEGHKLRGVSIERIVELVAEHPARAMSCYPAKGSIAIGSDADLAIVDMHTPRRVTASALGSAQDFTPYTGRELVGWPVITVLRGQVVLRDGVVTARPSGRYLARRADWR